MSWFVRPLSDVADFALGKMLDHAKNKGDLLPYLANINVRWGEFDLSELREMRFESNEIGRFALKYGDIVLCEGGEPGRCALWKDQQSGMMFQKALHRIRPHDCLDSHFLYYVFLNLGKSNCFAPYFTGATIKHLPREQLAKIEIRFPDVKTQKAIASVLANYDDLIENNQRRIKLLEGSARLLCREWFVHLRFPGHERVKVKDGVPEGWERKAIAQMVDISPTTRAPKDELRPFVPMQSLSETSMVIGEIELRKVSGGAKFKNGDTLFARITPCLENGKTGFVQFLENDESVASGSTEFIVLRSRTVNPFWIYCLARDEDFRGHAIRSMVGSDGRQRVSPKCFDQYYALQPPKGVLDEFGRLVQPNFEQVHQLAKQIVSLKQARDALLPKLMSGALQV